MDSQTAIPKDNSASMWAARIASLLFHPIWLPLVFAAWRSWGDPKMPLLLIVLATCLIAFPGSVALLWMWIRRETDWFVMAQVNRLVPMVAALIGLAIFAVANGGLLPERLFQGELMAVMILLVFISILVNLFWKISVHMLSWGAVAVFTFHFGYGNGLWWAFGAGLAISAVVAWARMRVRSHDWAQVVVGFGAGIAAAVLIVLAFP